MMNGQYGEFSNQIIALDRALKQVRTVWTDPTSASFTELNENIKIYAEKIWAMMADSHGGLEAVKKNYNAEETDREIAVLGMRIEQVRDE